MLKLFLLVTGLVSFLHFAFSESIPNSKKIGEVLGISKMSSLANFQVVSIAVNIYCLNKGHLPENLNILYQDELSKNNKIDLDSIFTFQKGQNCEFKLKPK